jgi:PilZ domain
MELPEEIFKELSAGATFDRSSPGARLRAMPRAKMSIEASVVRLGPGRDSKPVAARVVDLSMHGVGLEMREPIHADEPFAMRLKRKDGSALWIYCMAVRWSVLGKDLCSVGARFSRMITPGGTGGAPAVTGAAENTRAA